MQQQAMTKFLAKVRDANEAKFNSNNKSRGYLGMSQVGSPCLRKLWLECFGGKSSHFAYSNMAAIEDGNYGEDVMVERLAVAGIKVLDQQRAFCLKFNGREFKGHWDGRIIIPEDFCSDIEPGEYVWEHKQVGKPLAKIDPLSLFDWNVTYYSQAQSYMKYSDIPQHLTTIASAGGRDFIVKVTKYDAQYAQRQEEKAELICDYETIPPCTGGWECKRFGCYDKNGEKTDV